MLKSVLIPLLAGCLLLVPASALPARAGNQDLLRVLAGIAAIYVVGRAIKESRADAAEDESPRWRDSRRHDLPRLLPRRCEVKIRGRDDTRGWRSAQTARARAFDRTCLQQSVARPDRLPDQCRQRLSTRNGTRDVYGGRCLAQNGWQVARRAR